MIASHHAYTTADALLATTAHEYDNKADGFRAFDTVSDLHNNFIGAQIIRMIKDPITGEDTDFPDTQHIQTELLGLLQDGTLWRIDNQSIGQVEKTNNESIYDQ